MSAISVPTVKGLLVLDNEGRRISAKYCSSEFADQKSQAAFEKKIFQKASRSSNRVDTEVVLLDKYIIVHKCWSDAYVFVFASSDENELILLSVLTALEDTLTTLLRNQLNKKLLFENLDYLLLTVDEILDDGMILEVESSQLLNRVVMRGADKDVPISEQTFSQALATAKEQLVRSFRN